MKKNDVDKPKLQNAISENYGIKTHIAKQLHICRHTLDKYINQYDLVEFLNDQKDVLKDLVRFNIVQAIINGDIKVSMWYAERQMFDEFGNKQQIINENKNVDATENMTDEEIRAEIERINKGIAEN